MKRKILYVLLPLEAALVLLLALLTQEEESFYAFVFSFPFQQIGRGLGSLAREANSALLRGAAVALWVGLSALPLLRAFGKGTDRLPERLTLVLLSVVLFLGFYGIANPDRMKMELFSEEIATRNVYAAIGTAIWSVLLLYGVLRLLRRLRADGKLALLRDFRSLVLTLSFLLTGWGVWSAVLAWNGQDWGKLSNPDLAVDLLRVVVQMLPVGLELIVCFRALKLLDHACAGEREQMIPAARGLGRVCGWALIGTVGSSMLLNLVQVQLMGTINEVHVALNFPIYTLLLILVILLITRLMTENRELQDEARLFI